MRVQWLQFVHESVGRGLTASVFHGWYGSYLSLFNIGGDTIFLSVICLIEFIKFFRYSEKDTEHHINDLHDVTHLYTVFLIKYQLPKLHSFYVSDPRIDEGMRHKKFCSIVSDKMIEDGDI